MNQVAERAVEGTEIVIRDQQVQESEIYKPSQSLSPERIEFLWGLAEKIGTSSLVPLTLKKGRNDADLPRDQVLANVFFVVEQADRWNISPFALMPCASVVHGRLGFEGKVIDAVLEGVYGIKLKYEWSGSGEDMTIVVSGADRHGVIETIEGSVKAWKTTGAGTPWRPDTFKKMLAYRGAREWARVHKSVAMLGIVSDDELHEAEMERRAHSATDVSGGGRLERFRGQASGGNDATDVSRQLADAGHKPSDKETGSAEPNTTDRRPDGGADRINGDEPSGKTPSSAQPKGQTGVTSAGSEKPSTAAGQLDLGGDVQTDAQLLTSFSDHLFTITEGGMKVLRPAATAWRDKHVWPKKGDDVNAKKIESIYAQHNKRLAGDFDADACTKAVSEIIGSS